ncbi:DUF58 domain-containing protein [Streptomyces sp. NBC_01497]|uniref:DUF58 domain-containing protein n=1 Tax=Streptomyces sp. NBC_01497 TaxID=2903885 RepID=UPI002E35DCBE|nr:DUF58 domain-containing protein [Streptomyces sp. NBC_01497]
MPSGGTAPGTASAPAPAPGGPGGREGGLRTALSGLTTRGRAFFAAGAAASVCAYVLGQPDLLRVGLLLIVLPLVCVIVLNRTRYQVAGTRRLTPGRVATASEARVHLRVDNVSRLPTGLLMLQDHVPYVLGPRPRFVLDRVEAGGRREVSYRVRSDLRGRYPLGPLQLRLTDPFGMCELTRSFSSFDTLTVVPRTEPLPPVRLSGDSSGFGDGRLRSLALAGEDDMIPRGYRHGDDLRRVHWRSTARYGELMVRREEAPRRARCTVLLDTRAGAYLGTGPDSAFEWAVSGAASVLAHMMERGYAVRLLTDSGASVPGDGGEGFAGPAHESADSMGLLMDTLAVVDHSKGSVLSPAYDALRGGSEGLLVAFLGDLDEEQAAVVARMRMRSGPAVAFLLDAGTWAPVPGTAAPAGSGAGQRAGQLREAGWSVVRVPPGGALPALWRQAAEAGQGAYAPDAGDPGGAGERAAPGAGGGNDRREGWAAGDRSHPDDGNTGEGGPQDGGRDGSGAAGRAATGGPTGFSGGWS